MKLKRLIILIYLTMSAEALFSSFWEPLLNPRILNYRVDAKFDPAAAKLAGEEYQQKYGVRGERLIAEFGSGRTPSSIPESSKDTDVRFLYTYRGANRIY